MRSETEIREKLDLIQHNIKEIDKHLDGLTAEQGFVYAAILAREKALRWVLGEDENITLNHQKD